MTNAVTIIRSLVVYGLCIPLAIFLGYLLALPMDMGSMLVVVVALALPLVPVLLRWHHPLLALSWNMSVVLFFLPGRPNLWIVMAALSLGIAVLQHILNRDIRFLHVPSVAVPLIFLALVIVVTIQLTGGIGIRSLGSSEAYGGKRYILLLGAIVGYFAFTSRAVPPGQAFVYVAMYFLSALTSAIANAAPLLDPSLYFIFAFFPVENLTAIEEPIVGSDAGLSMRMGGLTQGTIAMVWFILARHGLGGLMDISERWRFLPFRLRGGFFVSQPWRLLVFLAAAWLAMLGGYRSTAISLALALMILFVLERLWHTRLLPVSLMFAVLLVAIGLPLVHKMPLTIQRSLAFLPLDIDPVAKMSADVSTEWRLRIWREVIPTIPQYLILGKGYAINAAEQQLVRTASTFSQSNSGQEHMLTGDYHNGPLSVIIPLGIFGAIGFVWFLIAGIRLLLNNYRHGDPALRLINTFLLAYFLMRVIFFFAVFGSLYLDLMMFTGIVGLSVCLNGGMRRPVPVVRETPVPNQLRLARAARSGAQ
jgi:O-antigen ligase